MTVPRVSVIVPVYNDAQNIGNCIASVLSQTVCDLELIIVDDGSTDGTQQVIQRYPDQRIRYIRNDTNLGEPASRNVALECARAEYIFFVDADCIAAANWIEEGLRQFAAGNYLGVEGKLYFVSPGYKSVYSDRVVENLKGGEYMTANMAYRKDALFSAGLFDPVLKRYCDADMALRVKEHGEIKFAPQMVVTHAHSKWTRPAYFHYAKAVRYDVLVFKRHGRKYNYTIHGRIYAPEKLLAIIFPPLVLVKLLLHRYKSKEDLALFLLMYPRLLYERLWLWKSCVEERVVLL
jgi:glycosyltransferase involved in cell wall biosynthesis